MLKGCCRNVVKPFCSISMIAIGAARLAATAEDTYVLQAGALTGKDLPPVPIFCLQCACSISLAAL